MITDQVDNWPTGRELSSPSGRAERSTLPLWPIEKAPEMQCAIRALSITVNPMAHCEQPQTRCTARHWSTALLALLQCSFNAAPMQLKCCGGGSISVRNWQFVAGVQFAASAQRRALQSAPKGDFLWPTIGSWRAANFWQTLLPVCSFALSLFCFSSQSSSYFSSFFSNNQSCSLLRPN